MLAIATTRVEPRTSPGQLEELRSSPGQLEDESLSLIGHCGVVNVSSRRLRSAGDPIIRKPCGEPPRGDVATLRHAVHGRVGEPPQAGAAARGTD